jgi:hypothetical protein
MRGVNPATQRNQRDKMKKHNSTQGTPRIGSSALLGHNRTAMEMPSINGNLPAGSVSHTWDSDMLKDQLNRVL